MPQVEAQRLPGHAQTHIIVRGAREHNLKNIDVAIPRDKLVVITGLSGSGKSSLAFDTIYAEGQRRYVESLSAYARQFLGLMEKPDVDLIEGLSPAISIDQKGASRNPRSTVGTITEIYDYMRLLFARVGHPHCPNCGREIHQQSSQEIVDAVQSLPEGSRILVLAPIIRDRKGEHQKVLEDLRRAGYVRARVDGEVRDLDTPIDLEKYKMHTIEAVVDRLVVRSSEAGSGEVDPDRTRLADSVETALKLGKGMVVISIIEGEELTFSEHFACPNCGISLGAIEPRTFSFNSPHGACPVCTGLGTQVEPDPDLIVPDRNLSIIEGGLAPWARSFQQGDSYMAEILEAVGRAYNFNLETPLSELSEEQIKVLLYGSEKKVRVRHKNYQGRWHEYDVQYEGAVNIVKRRHSETTSDTIRGELERFMSDRPCHSCRGQRLKPESLSVTVDDKNIAVVAGYSVREAAKFFQRLGGDTDQPTPLSEKEQMIARQILKEIRERLGFLMDVGLNYLTINRTAATLAGGEAQRIRLATQIGSSLMGVLYILDEPSIGLHQRDNVRLINTLVRLRDLGNTLIVVEHDEETMRVADWIIDIGPGAGEHGGKIIAEGTYEDVLRSPDSITAKYLTGEREIALPKKRRKGNGKSITVHGATENNLKDVTVEFPLGKFICVTGVSGSGKSTLVHEVLSRKISQTLHNAKDRPGAHRKVEGIEHIDKMIEIDQSPIGRTPRSNPATYTGAFTPIREIFAKVPEAKVRGYDSGRFSFNVKGGRCEACRGDGIIQIEMQFLPDVYVPCEVCHGARYNRETLEIRYKGKNIAEVLEMTVEEANDFFDNVPAIKNKLKTLCDVGLGYIRVGQPATTLSGGEAQRIKLAAELSRRSTGKTLYILDEPTTGLHFADIDKLLHLLQRLTEGGNTVLVIEHNLDVIKTADWIIDLGPEGGDAGGEVVAVGTPEDVADTPGSYTGEFLRKVLPGADKSKRGAA
ncbi:MAG: excinuclease ABC subunit UvrA [Chloroflexota bacterium]|nr:excinuclease ABC subunit UvrA [Chloroflexota bacterium]MDQ5865679.1 excinuclease ABC subunit UvrA [Chloroflexota bacterium]